MPLPVLMPMTHFCPSSTLQVALWDAPEAAHEVSIMLIMPIMMSRHLEEQEMIVGTPRIVPDEPGQICGNSAGAHCRQEGLQGESLQSTT